MFLDSKYNTKGNENFIKQSSASKVNMKVFKCAEKGGEHKLDRSCEK